jgi:2-methylisocitrate lyase-like PEP mutase family enzyme
MNDVVAKATEPQELRALIAAGGAVVAPLVFNPLSAKLAEAAGSRSL